MTPRPLILSCLLAALCLSPARAGDPVGSAFTYQGELVVDGAPAHGSFELEFELFASESGPTSVALPLARALTLEQGVFDVRLDFGDAPFTGSPIWLEVRVRPAGSSDAFTSLAPRQPITAAPYALHAQFVSANAISGSQIADGSVSGQDIDPASVQRRVNGTCPEGQAIRVIDQNGAVICEAGGGADDDWLPIGDGSGRLQSTAGIRIQPAPATAFPFTVRHNSAAGSPSAALTESEAGDAARLGFYNDSDPTRFWTLEGLIAGAVADDRLSLRNSATGGSGADILSIDGEGRVGVMVSEPLAALQVRSEGNFAPDVGEGRGDLYVGDGSVGLSIGVALGGGGRGTSRIWSNTQGAIVFGNTDQDVMSIGFNGDRVGIGVNLPSERLHVAGGNLRVEALGHPGSAARPLQVAPNGVVQVGGSATGRLVLNPFSFAPAFSSQPYFRDFGYLTAGSGPTAFHAEVKLPDGVRVSTLTAAYRDLDPSFDLRVELRRVNLATFNDELMAGFTTSGDQTGLRTTINASIDHAIVDNQNYFYFAYLYANGWDFIEARNVNIDYAY